MSHATIHYFCARQVVVGRNTKLLWPLKRSTKDHHRSYQSQWAAGAVKRMEIVMTLLD